LRTDLVGHLEKKFGKGQNNMMLDARGNMVEAFRNLEAILWTLTVTIPGGRTCYMSSGESFVQETRMTEVEECGC